MTSPGREIPTTHAELVDAIANKVFPHERSWLDFKEMLYPPAPPVGGKPQKTKDEVHEELARDLASMAVRGGTLIYGVHEDKQNHSFTVAEMDLPAHLDQTIDQVGRARVTPPLYVTPTLVPNPADPSRGLLVVEVPVSPTTPHMVGGVYYGRSETGKVPLPDDEVERLILLRGQVEGQLRAEMVVTRESANPMAQWPDRVSHLYLTALPTQPWPEMFLSYTQNRAARMSFHGLAVNVFNATRADDGADRPSESDNALAALMDNERGQRIRGAWFYNWSRGGGTFPCTERSIGIGDDGAVRYIDMNAGSRPNGHSRNLAAAADRGHPVVAPFGRPLVFEFVMWWRTLDVLRLIAHLAAEANYQGSWLIGIELDRLRGHMSSSGVMYGSSAGYDDDGHSNHIRAATADLAQRPRTVTNRLLRPLFRDLGAEQVLPAGEA